MIDNNYTEEEQEEISKKLLFCVQELGSVQNVNNKQVYIVGTYVESGVKDIIKVFKNENQEYPLIKYYLTSWDILDKDLKNIVITQNENKSLLYQVLSAMAYITEPVIASEIDKFKYKNQLITGFDESKGVFADSEFMTILVKELSECIKRSSNERNKYEQDMIELILTIFRNSLFFVNSIGKKTKSVNKLENLFLKMIDVYSQRGGVFDALVFISSNLDPMTIKLSPILMESFYLVIEKVNVLDVFGDRNEQEMYKKLKEIEKHNIGKRRQNVLSVRHSRFGAFLELRKKGKAMALLSDPKSLAQAKKGIYSSNGIRNKINKPRSRVISKITKEKQTNYKISLSTRIRDQFRRFFNDMLTYAFTPITDTFFDFIYSSEHFTPTTDNFKMYVDFLNFGLESATLLTGKGVQCEWYLSSIQISIVDFIYRNIVQILGFKKTEINYSTLESCINYFMFLLEAVKQLGQFPDENLVRNAKKLEEALFSKDISRMLKICFKTYSSYPNYKANVSLIKTADIFFSLLNDFAHNKVITIRTQNIRDDYVADNEEDMEIQQKIGYREKKFNFITELTNFIDTNVVQSYIEFLKEKLYANASKALKSAIYNLLKLIIEDLEASWYFYQVDTIECFYEFCTLDNILITKETIYQQTKHLIMTVFGMYREKLQENNLLLVESLFRYESHSTLSNILNNYCNLKTEANELNVNLSKLVINNETKHTEWKINEDLVIVKNFNALKDDKAIFEKLSSIIQIQCDTYKSVEEVRDRVNVLELETNPIGIVEEKLKNKNEKNWLQRHFKLKQKLKRSSRLPLLEEFFGFMNNQFTKFEMFKIKYSQLVEVEFSIVPINKEQSDLLELFSPVLSAYEFIEPRDGYNFWRIPAYSSKENLDKIIKRSRDSFENKGVKKPKKKQVMMGEDMIEDDKVIINLKDEESEDEDEDIIKLELSDSDEDIEPLKPLNTANNAETGGDVNLLELITGKEEKKNQKQKKKSRLVKIRTLNK